MYVVAFNGPPKCGKDTLSQLLVEYLDSRVTVPVKQESLSFPLRRIAYAMTDWNAPLDGPGYEDFKLTHFGEFGKDGRQLMIDVSEKFLKPTYGIPVMAKMLTTRNLGFEGLLLIRDSGFQVEVNELIDIYGAANVYVVNVMRNGCDFSNDSREWVSHRRSGNQMQVNNNFTLDDLATEAGRIYGRLVNQLGWIL